MTPEALFAGANGLAVIGWLALLVAPRWPLGARVVGGVAIPAVLGLAYLGLVVRHLPGVEGGFGTLAEVAQLFADPWVLLAGWIHYLAFDLFVGGWEVRDAGRLGIPHAAVVPCLGLTFLLGPIGLLSYLGLRAALRRRVALGADG